MPFSPELKSRNLTVTRQSGKQHSWKRFHRISFQSPWEEHGGKSKKIYNKIKFKGSMRSADHLYSEITLQIEYYSEGFFNFKNSFFKLE